VGVVLRAQHTARTNPDRLKARHPDLHAKLPGSAIGSDDDAVPTPSTAHPDRVGFELQVERDPQRAKKLSPPTCWMRIGPRVPTKSTTYRQTAGVHLATLNHSRRKSASGGRTKALQAGEIL